MEEMTPAVAERATIGLVYKLVNELAQNVDERFRDMEGAVREEMRSQFGQLLDAINALRGGVVSQSVCVAQHKAYEDERDQMRDAIKDVQSQLKWAAGLIIVEFFGLVVLLLRVAVEKGVS